ncbi:homeobox-domain-containing protein [Obba rivulosa]|uniref:Homeobox-domain-containing protein n=1 Tax=Obba rivulosa TaxID=1052685 RepID=A0A8E2DNG0_9APHY|nr:homeobox-domain-containing protein [Obba rivulosa]
MHAHTTLYRSTSRSSISSDDSNISVDSTSNMSIDSTDNAAADASGAQRARTRKRFSSMQLMLLEQLYHQTSHPTREQRETLARTIDMETRSVTVWFQNKRQTERRVAMHNASGVSSTSSGSPPFTTSAQANSLHPTRTRPTPQPASPKHGDMNIYRHASLDRKLVRAIREPSKRSRLSLDHVAARAERPHPPRRTASMPTWPVHLEPETSPLSQPAPQTPKAKSRALWENMPSSPITSDTDGTAQGGSPARLEHAYVAFGHGRVTRMRTLEWACAAARVSSRCLDSDLKNEAGGLELDLGGDTEDEGGHEAVTPKSSWASIDSRKSKGGKTGHIDVVVRVVEHDKENIPMVVDKENAKVAEVDNLRIAESKTSDSGKTGAAHDKADMDAALVLCGLRRC